MLAKIADNLINYSLKLNAEDKLNIIVRGKSQEELGKEVVKLAKLKGIKTRLGYENVKDFDLFTDEEFENFFEQELEVMKKCDACVLLIDQVPVKLSDKGYKRREKFYRQVHLDVRCKKKWALTSVPCVEACGSEEKTKELIDVFMKASSIDYSKFEFAMENLSKRFANADKVKIIAKDTNLTFSVKNMPIVKCIGKRNLPDGEIYCAPIKDSVNGYITYNLPSTYNGVVHKNIYFEFKNGKIINAESSNTEELLKILNTDEGVRYIGEFSFGLNPFIKRPYNNTLFDEKISGTIHFTPGDSLSKSDNGNRSAVHWDIVQSHDISLGGGEIWFDNQLIRKDGLFVLEDLKCLNPENLARFIAKSENEITK